MHRLDRFTLTTCLLVSCACTGTIGDTGDDPLAQLDACVPKAAPQAITLLAPRHYASSVRDLLGLTAFAAPKNTGGSTTSFFANATDRVSTVLGYELQSLAETAAEQAKSNIPRIAPCAANADAEACAETFIRTFGRRAFRRPVTSAEIDALRGVYRVGVEEDGGYGDGIALVVQAVLQAPSFLYRREVGTPSANPDINLLDDFEVATELAFLITDTTPDDMLLDAAEDGRLATEEGLAAEVDRLIRSDLGKKALLDMVLRLFELPRLDVAERNDPAFDTELRASMREESRRFVSDVLEKRNGSLVELLSSRRTFVDPRLADHYGVAYPAGANGFVEVTVPADERAGLLTQASWLTAFADINETSVVKRGLFVAKVLLCEDIPAPPKDAVERTAGILAGLPDERARAEYRKGDSLCGSCHTSIDAYGVLFENYDPLGRFRTEAHGRPIDTSWEVEAPPSVAGDATALVPVMERFARAPEVGACMANKVASNALGRPLTKGEACSATSINEAFARTGDINDLVRAVATWPGLRERARVTQ